MVRKSRQIKEKLEAEFITPTQATQRLGISLCFLYQLLKEGEIASVRLGKKILIPKRVIDKMLDPK